MIDYPFKLQYWCVKYPSKPSEWKPHMFYKGKITECTYEYNCELSDILYNIAIKSKSV